MYFLSSLYSNDDISIGSYMHNKENIKSYCDMTPWVPQGGLINIELDLLDPNDITNKLDDENNKVVHITNDNPLTKIREVNLYYGNVLPPRITP